MNYPDNAIIPCWAVIPAAGVGRRMGSDIPKQYLELNGKTVIEHTIERLAGNGHISGIVVALSEGDPYWPTLELSLDKPLYVVDGGAERCHSVLNALNHLEKECVGEAWVLVHDAARPCIRQDDINHLIATLREHPVGGLLGLPVSDTVKRTDEKNCVRETIDRSHLWRALTPQMFRLSALRPALQTAIERGAGITDDASAMEGAGNSPLMVEGHGDNIKITRPQDLMLAALYMKQQEAD